MVFNTIGIYLFMQFIDVVIFVASNQAMIDLTGSQGISIVPALAFLIIFIVNVLLIFYAGVKAMFTITENSKVLGFAIGAMTGQITRAIGSIRTTPAPVK
ncbi:MAG: hypothetical protein HYS80_01000 [Candidatus Aenigmarchaeota archaeon]|nr:hypothetical protein [Candidatus Aenigmarchaeota archaeon]